MDNLPQHEHDLANKIVQIKQKELEARTRKRNEIEKIANYTNGDSNHPLYIHIINLNPNLFQKDGREKFWDDHRTADELLNLRTDESKTMVNLSQRERDMTTEMVQIKANELEARRKQNGFREIATYTNNNKDHPLYIHLINRDPVLFQSKHRSNLWDDHRTVDELRNLR